MSKASQLKSLVAAFTSGGKKAVEAAVKSAGSLSIADMRKVSEKVAATNPRAGAKLTKALDSGKGTAKARISKAYKLDGSKLPADTSGLGGKKKPTNKPSLKDQDDVLPEPPKGLATSKSQATDTTDLSSKPTRPEPVAKTQGRPKGEPDIPQEQGMQPAQKSLPLDPTTVMEGKGVKAPDGVPYERRSARTLQAVPERQMATSTPESELFNAVDETMGVPSLSPSNTPTLAQQEPSVLTDLLNSGEFGTIPEAGLDARGRTPLTPVGDDARTAGMLTEGEAAYPQAGVLETAAGENLPQRADPNFIRSSDPGTALSVMPTNNTPPPVDPRFKSDNIYPGGEQGFTVPDTTEGNIRRLTGPVDRTPPSVDPSLAADSIAPDAITGPGVPVTQGNELIVQRTLPQSIYPRTSAEELARTANTQGGPFTFGRTPEVEQAGELIPTKKSMGDQMAGAAYREPVNGSPVPPKSGLDGSKMASGNYGGPTINTNNATTPPKVQPAATGLRKFAGKHPIMATLAGSSAAVMGGAVGNALVDSALDSYDELNADVMRKNAHSRSMEALKKLVVDGDKDSLLESNQKMNRMFNGNLPEPPVEQRPSNLKNKKPINFEETI